MHSIGDSHPDIMAPIIGNSCSVVNNKQNSISSVVESKHEVVIIYTIIIVEY